MLLRDGPAGVEVFVQERASTMEFAPAMVVFPGGRVDPKDAAAEVRGEVLDDLTVSLGLPSPQVRAIVGAALREVEEECGVRLSAGELRPRAHWVTPVIHPRRYDTWFFAAAMPEGQVALGTTSETTSEMWGRPAELLERGRAGEIAMMPPTIVMLEELDVFGSVDDVLADAPALTVVEPMLEQGPDGWHLRSVIP